MPWQAFIALSVTANIGFILLQRRYSQRSTLPARFPPAIWYIFGVWPVGILVGIVTSHHINWSWWLAFLLIGGSLAVNASSILFYIATKHLRVARLQTIAKLTTIVVIILSGILLNERLTPWQLVGGTLLLAGALIAIRAPRRTDNTTEDVNTLPYILMAIVAAIALGIGLIAEKSALGHMDVGAYLIFGYGAQAVGLFFIAAKSATKESLRSISWQDVRSLVTMGAVLGITGTSYVAGLAKSDNIALVTIITSCSLPLSVLASYLILHERDNPRLLYLSLAISFTGLLIVGLAK